jgi:AmiR/NasT family two-component response regulator
MKALTVLVAEDESIIRLGLKRILEQAGHTVDAAEDGVAALALAEARTPDVAVVDIKMPRMDGLTLAQRLYERAPVPIVLLTAYGDRDIVERAARLPILGYLLKPIKEAELLAMVEVAHSRFGEHASTAQAAAEAGAELRAHRTIDRARGLLMQRDGISELEAYGRLQQRARTERKSLLELCEELLATR